jgi:CBS domain containing-hemolysin-like protein
MSSIPSESDSKTPTAYEATSLLTRASRWFREKVVGRTEGSLKEMIEEALEDESGNISDISAEEKSILKNMIHFGELTVRDIMVPRSDIMALEQGVSMEALKNHVIDIGHTRIPVYRDSLDHVQGFIHVKDLFPYMSSGQPFLIDQVLREILFIPPSMRIVDLLMKMRVSGCHVAIVVDEYGGTDGLVTMEDLFEELVGEIQDEHDGHEANPHFRWVGDQILEADARTSIENIEHALGEKLMDADAHHEVDTLGGFIFSTLGRVPVRGEVMMLKPSLKAEIMLADPRRIRQVRLTRVAG